MWSLAPWLTDSSEWLSGRVEVAVGVGFSWDAGRTVPGAAWYGPSLVGGSGAWCRGVVVEFSGEGFVASHVVCVDECDQVRGEFEGAFVSQDE